MPNSDSSLAEELEITFEPYFEPSLKDMPSQMVTHLNQLSDMISKDAQQVLPGLIELVEKHNNVPVLSNLLYAAYSVMNDMEQAEKVAFESYKKFPKYLFSKVNYAHICLMKNDLDKIPDIFENKFDLREMYPKRKRFHITEFISFYGVTCLYFCEKGEIETAKKIYDSLEEVAPDHEMTLVLKKRLNTPFMKKVISKLFKKKSKSKN